MIANNDHNDGFLIGVAVGLAHAIGAMSDNFSRESLTDLEAKLKDLKQGWCKAPDDVEHIDGRGRWTRTPEYRKASSERMRQYHRRKKEQPQPERTTPCLSG